MSTQIKLKRSAIAGRVPTIEQLDFGELALNTNDGILYTKVEEDNVISIRDLSIGTHARIETHEFIANEGQTTFIIPGGYNRATTPLIVFQNGIMISPTQYIATNGTNIVFNEPTVEDDNIVVVKTVNIIPAITEIDDNIISLERTWSSQKIHDEIEIAINGGEY
jgi:hypothetical protein